MKKHALVVSGLLVVSLSAHAQTKSQGSSNGAPFQDLQQAIDAAATADAAAIEANAAKIEANTSAIEANSAAAQANESALQAEASARLASDSAASTALALEEAARIAEDNSLGDLIAASQELIRQNAAAIAALNTELANAGNQIAATNARIDSVISTVTANSQAIADALALIDRNEGNIELLQGALADLARDTADNIAALRGEVLAIEGEIRTLIQDNAGSLNELRGLVAQLRVDVDANEAALDPLSANVAFLLTNVAGNTNSISLLQNQHESLTTRLNGLQDSLGALNAEMLALKNRVTRLESYHYDLVLGDVVAGTLSGDEALSQVRSGAYADYYTFEIDSTRTVTIDMGSPNLNSNSWYGPGFFDAFLFLHRGDCQNCVIAYDDDTFYSLNAQITITLEPGVYTIEATSYSGSVTGSYELRLQ